MANVLAGVQGPDRRAAPLRAPFGDRWPRSSISPRPRSSNWVRAAEHVRGAAATATAPLAWAADKAEIAPAGRELARKRRSSRSWEKRWPSSPGAGTSRGLLLHPARRRPADPDAQDRADVPGVRGVPVGLLRLGSNGSAARRRGRAAQDRTAAASRSGRSTPTSPTTAPRGSTGSCWPGTAGSGRHRVARLMRQHGIRATPRQDQVPAPLAPPARRPEIVDLVQTRLHRHRREPAVVHRHHPDPHRPGLAVRGGRPGRLQPRGVSWAVDELERPTHRDDARYRRIRIRTAAAGLRDPLRPRLPVHRPRLARPRRRTGLSSLDRRTQEPLDNAMMESWFASFKNEEIYPNGLPLQAEARIRLFRYIYHTTPGGCTRPWAT